jgi:hypothetical protein
MWWCDEWHFGPPHHRFVRSPKSPPFRKISKVTGGDGLVLVELLFLVLVDGGGSIAASFLCSLFRSGSFKTTSLVVVVVVVAAGLLLLLFRFVRRSWVLVILLLLRL